MAWIRPECANFHVDRHCRAGNAQELVTPAFAAEVLLLYKTPTIFADNTILGIVCNTLQVSLNGSEQKRISPNGIGIRCSMTTPTAPVSRRPGTIRGSWGKIRQTQSLQNQKQGNQSEITVLTTITRTAFNLFGQDYPYH